MIENKKKLIVNIKLYKIWEKYTKLENTSERQNINYIVYILQIKAYTVIY